MPFNHSDIYTTSAGNEIFNYFNPFVTKFDSQSFYNFEQDNQPLYDLEERTQYLWEKSTGYGTSSVYGIPLVVSGSLDPTNRNVFTSLQTAVDALPNVINCPVLVEVAASGYLGGLDLKNIKINQGGSLEIVNRGFAKIYSGLGNDLATSSIAKSVIKQKYQGLITEVSSLDLSSTIMNTSALSVATNVSGLFRNDKHNRTFVQYTNLNTEAKRRNDKLSVGFIGDSTNVVTFLDGDPSHTFTIPNFEKFNYVVGNPNIQDDTIFGGDVSGVRGDTRAFLNRNGNDSAYTLDNVAGLSYCNSLSSISIENCNGPLYVRGFCVDGVSGADANYVNSIYRAETGIKVINSNPVIENCSVLRATTNGAEFINSDVTLARGFFAYRNYEIKTAARLGRKTTGIKAVNSRIELQPNYLYASGADYCFNIQAHDYGVSLENSVLVGGQTRPSSDKFDTTVAFSYNDIGIHANNSVIAVSGNLDVYGNNKGIVINDSELSTDRLTVENNNNEGILANNSTITYNNRHDRRLYVSDVSSLRTTQTLFQRNGIHLSLKNSSNFTYDNSVSAKSYPASIGAVRFADSHGVVGPTAAVKYQLPSIELDNSEASIIHGRVNCSGLLASTQAGVKGAAIHAANSSKVALIGTVNGATMLVGPVTTNSRNSAAAYADKGSKITFSGPTVIAQFGTGVVADNNSLVEFCPRKTDDFVIDASGFGLYNAGNHTSVEIHTNHKACIVANNSSKITMEDLGSPGTLFAESGTDYALTEENGAYVKAGSMQFYPNPANSTYVGALRRDVGITDIAESSDKMTATSEGSLYYNYYITNPRVVDSSATIMNHVSLGGFCVQAMADSVVYVNGVHFPMGHARADGSFYDASAHVSGRHQLRIWNIADSSKLYASHVAVSGLDPAKVYVDSSSVYYGPRSTFFSGVTVEGNTGDVYDNSGKVAYAAPRDTPDTGALSVLDAFGLGVGVKNYAQNYNSVSKAVSSLNNIRVGVAEGTSVGDSIYGFLEPSNIGPFTIYFSPKTEARSLSYLETVSNGARGDLWATDTRPLQHIAQGYSLSGNAGVHPNLESVSAFSTALFAVDPLKGTTDLSGYYYPSAMLVGDRGTQVYLDRSAANIFSNAKHNAQPPISGQSSPKVSIYDSTTNAGGEGYVGPGSVHGRGSGIKSLSIWDIRRNL